MLFTVQKRRHLWSVGLPLLRLVCGAALAAFCLPAATLAQVGGQVAEPLPSRDSLELSAALSRLSREPRNVDALVDAGIAASKLGDFEAAVGFFRRGQALAPTNSRLLSGLAGALVRQGAAAAAVPLFAQAQAAGAPPKAIAADRGLAHDLIGDPVGAQRFYAQALAAGGDADEVTRRLAISQAIAGDGVAMEKTLLPLLRKQDKPAWRARAFGLAILGQDEEASRIVKTLLPGRLADGITPYLQYMPRLTRAQQAAAANLGIFPRASEIGRDVTRLATLAGAASGREPGKALVPSGKALGPAESDTATVSPGESRKTAKESQAEARRDAKLASEQRKRDARLAESQRRVAPPEPRPTREEGDSADSGFAVAREAAVPKVAEILQSKKTAEAPAAKVTTPETRLSRVAAAQVSSEPASAAEPVSAPIDAPARAASSSAAVAASRAPATVAVPGFDLSSLSASSASVPAPSPPPESEQASAAVAPASAPAPAIVEPGPAHSFGALFADLAKPTMHADPAAGSVDIRKIKPARPNPEPRPEARKTAPSHPSRIWVQLGIGQKIAALSYDWRRLEKANASLFRARKPYSARLNRTNRLLTGPFASRKEADTFIDALKRAGITGPYIWISPAGEVVDDLSR